MNGYLTIGEVAKRVGVPSKTIRYYEEIKLLYPAKRLENKYRSYSERDLARLRLIKQARGLGLPLSEVKQLVEECTDRSCEHLKGSFLAIVPKYITSAKERINELQALHRKLESLQRNLGSLHLTNPKVNVVDKDCCEVLGQVEMVTKGGDSHERRKKKS